MFQTSEYAGEKFGSVSVIRLEIKYILLLLNFIQLVIFTLLYGHNIPLLLLTCFPLVSLFSQQ